MLALLNPVDELILFFPADASAEVNAIKVDMRICRSILYFG